MNNFSNISRIIFSVLASLLLMAGLSFSQDSTQTPYSPQHQLDINNASYEEIARLPITPEMATKIYDRITYQGPLASVYDLNKIEGMTQLLFLKIKR
ncbi:MAG: helix-hairpin-helix domain-containing protein, partial [Calditrichota bacterium]